MTANILTKAQLLAGSDYTEEVQLESADGVVEIRPLTSAEWAKVQAKQLSGFEQEVTGEGSPQEQDEEDESNTQFSLTMDLGQVVENENEANVLAVYYGLVSDEDWKLDQVRRLPPGVIDELSEAIYDLSGVTEEARSQVENFRSLAERAEDD